MRQGDENRVREIVREELGESDANGAVEADDDEVASLRGTVGNLSGQVSRLRDRLDDVQDALEEQLGEELTGDDGEG